MMTIRSLSALLLLAAASPLLHAAEKTGDAAWWNKAWTQRQAVTLDTAAAGTTEATGPATVLVRLHDGNFQFTSATEGGADLRFIAADGKTQLPYQVEKWDSLLNEAFVWVKLPDAKPGAKTTFHLYYGGGDAAAAAPAKTATYDESSSLVYHFAEATPADSTANANHSTTSATLAEGSLIGKGLRLPSPAPVTIPESASLAWTQGQDLTLSAWIKPASLQVNAVILARENFRVLLDQGIPVIEVAGQRSPAGAPVAAATWNHLAVISKGGNLQLLLNGKAYAQLAAALPASTAPITLGSAATGEAFIGELDQFEIAKTARSTSAIQLAVANQGTTDAAARTLQLGNPEGAGAESHSAAFEHIMLFGDIAKNMMFDGWIAIGVCVLMITVGWTVALKKFAYLNSIQKGTAEFLKQWKALSSDLTAIDHTDDNSVKSFGGNADATTQQLIQQSPLYQIYHIGSEEIRHRLARDKDRTQGLSGRSIQAIRAALDAGLVHATHKLTNGLVYLTISIAGGPYVGLLGTVVGVMITFAIIAKSGEVDVNSIAPGIASALLATVAGLVVAIPALFIYSYLNNRIKNTTAEIHVFIDEFIARMAEFYPPAGEVSPYSKQPSSPEN
jgi:biopolymer transport protein ExbB